MCGSRIWALVMNFELSAIRLEAARSDVMFCSTGSEGHLVLFVPLDMSGGLTKRAHLCTDMCDTLTPVT